MQIADGTQQSSTASTYAKCSSPPERGLDWGRGCGWPLKCIYIYTILFTSLRVGVEVCGGREVHPLGAVWRRVRIPRLLSGFPSGPTLIYPSLCDLV